jgi:tripartite motif-containing protein 71
MSDRFDFLELGNDRPAVLPNPTDSEESGLGLGWKPLRLRAVEVIGEKGTHAGQFDTPTGLAVDPWGSLYVADSGNHRVQRITSGGDVYIYGKAGSGLGQLWGPQAVAIDPGGQFFFVAEQGNNRVQCFRFTGQHYVMYSGFRSPSGVTFDTEGMLWVADTGASKVIRIDTRTGTCLGTLDRQHGIHRPVSVACDKAHRLYVTEGTTNDVIRYNYGGTKEMAFADNRRLNLPAQTALDAQGRCYLAEAGANRLHVLDLDGNSLLTFDRPSTRLGPLNGPSGVALGPNGEIYVADTLNHRVLRLAWE